MLPFLRRVPATVGSRNVVRTFAKDAGKAAGDQGKEAEPTYTYTKGGTSVMDPNYGVSVGDPVYYYDNSANKPEMPPAPGAAPTSYSYATVMKNKKANKDDKPKPPPPKVEFTQPSYVYQTPGTSIRDPSYSIKDPVYVTDPSPVTPTQASTRPAAPFKPSGPVQVQNEKSDDQGFSYTYQKSGSSIADPLYNLGSEPVNVIDKQPASTKNKK